MPEYAIEADPGKLTASFPTFDSLDAAIRAATVPAFEREGLPWPRVLTRRGGRWYPVCAAPTWHGPCILLKDHDPGSAYHRGAGPSAQCSLCTHLLDDHGPIGGPLLFPGDRACPACPEGVCRDVT